MSFCRTPDRPWISPGRHDLGYQTVLTKCSTRTRSDWEKDRRWCRPESAWIIGRRADRSPSPWQEERKDEWMRKMTEDEDEEEEEKGGGGGGSGKERHGEEENGEKRANHTRCGEGERRYSYIVITRRARSTAGCQRCLGTRNEKATHGGKRSSRIRLRLERHEREKQEEVGESAVGLRRRRRRRRTSAARSQPA